MELDERKGPPPVGLPATLFNTASPEPNPFDPIGAGQAELPGKPPYPEKFAELTFTQPSEPLLADPKSTT